MTPPTPFAPRWLRPLAAAIAALGLAASVALVIDYLRPAPTFCAGTGGCATVRESAWAYPLGIPMPVAGVAYFAVALLLLHVERARRLLPWLAAVGALVAVTLLAVQGAVLGTWCKLCVMVDTSALAFAALVWLGRGRAWPAVRWVPGALLAAAAVAAPIALAVIAPPPAPAAPQALVGAALPEVVAREQRAGVVTVVDFIDFQCPFCRRMHERLSAALGKVGGPIRVVRKMVPLERIHPQAMSAAIAWCCADAQGKGEAMAEALFVAPVEELTAEGCERTASKLGVDVAAYKTCVAAPATAERVASEYAAAKAAGMTSLPTIYIGDQVFVGLRATQEELEAALRRAVSQLRS